MTVAVARRTSGRVMLRKIDQAPAPSIRAASKYSFGIATMPAMKISVAMPTPFQMSTPATVSRARFGSVYQPGSGRSKKPRMAFTMPWNGSSSALKVRPTPIVETSTGKKITARR